MSCIVLVITISNEGSNFKKFEKEIKESIINKAKESGIEGRFYSNYSGEGEDFC